MVIEPPPRSISNIKTGDVGFSLNPSSTPERVQSTLAGRDSFNLYLYDGACLGTTAGGHRPEVLRNPHGDLTADLRCHYFDSIRCDFVNRKASRSGTPHVFLLKFSA